MRKSKKTPLVIVSTSVDQETIEKMKAVAEAMKVTRSGISDFPVEMLKERLRCPKCSRLDKIGV
jgi:hypothetical protein